MIEVERPVTRPTPLPALPEPRRKNRTILQLCIALALVLVGGFGAHLVQTDFGKVDVTGFELPTENGQWITADLFKPVAATSANPVPMVVICPGFERSKETMDSYSIELARRGMAVIVIDPYNQGASSTTEQRRSASKEGYGVVPMVEFVHDSTNFDYVDKTRVGAAGYSAGGNAVLQSTSLFGAREAKALRHARRADSDGGKTVTDAELQNAHEQNKISATFVGGYVITMTDEVLSNIDANVGMDYAYFDEGAYRTQNGDARMHDAPEALRLVNSTLPDGQKISDVEIGKVYGDIDQHTLRVVHNTKNIHPLLPYDSVFVTHLVEFFTTAFKLQPAVGPASQTWQFKEFFTLLALAGAMLFLLPATALLLRLPPFTSLIHATPKSAPKPTGNGKLIFWANFTVSALLACFLFMPLAQATATLFPAASNSQPTWFFPQRINNAILLWAVANGLIGLLQFTLTYRMFGKKNGAAPALAALRISIIEFIKSLLLALIVCVAFYGLVFASRGLFHTDPRFLFVAASAAFQSKMLVVALEYLPLFFIFYAANSIRVNCAGRFDGQKEWVNLLINALANSVGLMLIMAIQYSCLASSGRVFWTDGWLYVNLLLGVIPMMFLLPYFHRHFFRLTGRVWLGPMITCLVFIMMMLTNNICYIPLK